MFEYKAVRKQKVEQDFPNGIKLYIKREDELHSEISGNKYRKLKYNFAEFQRGKYEAILSFGGAYSNHIAALAAMGRIAGIKTIGVIRGDELESKIQTNPTLKKAQSDGMEFVFVSRETYRNKTTVEFLEQLKARYGNIFTVPEGGTNEFAIMGTQEILETEDKAFDYVCSAVGTGGTLAGVINSSSENQFILGFPALKGDFLFKDISKFAKKSNWELILDYNFGGYAKYNNDLIDFISYFYLMTGIPLDPIYTGKMIYGVYQLIYQNYFKPNSEILVIHTGGLQGWNEKISYKN